MRYIYKPDNENLTWIAEVIGVDEEVLEGFTAVAPPSTPTYKPYFNWETNEWEEHATPEEIEQMFTTPEGEELPPSKEELRVMELEAQVQQMQEALKILLGSGNVEE